MKYRPIKIKIFHYTHYPFASNPMDYNQTKHVAVNVHPFQVSDLLIDA